MPTRRQSPPPVSHGRSLRVTCGLLALLVLVLALRPIGADGFWWHLSRGRAVFDGTMAPSRLLLASAQPLEPDWLGGVPFYFVHLLLGVWGLMVLKIAVVAGLAVWLFRRCGRRHPALTLATVVLGLLAAWDAWVPIPLMSDVLALVILWEAAGRWQDAPRPRTALLIAGTMLLWANLGTLPLLGIVVLVTRLFLDPPSKLSRRQWLSNGGILLMAVVCCCLTPRGPATLWDSARLLVPRLAAEAAVLELTKWQPLFQAEWGPTVHGFLALSLLAAGLLVVSGGSLWRAAVFLLIQALAWSSRANLAPAAIWLTLQALNDLQRLPQGQTAIGEFASNRPRARTALEIAAMLLLILAAVFLASGRWPGSVTRLGWGLSPRLEPQLFRAALDGIELQGTAHCAGPPAAGILAWINLEQVRPWQTQTRSLLTGRLREEILLNRDLAQGRRDWHRREDGTTTGWWLPLEARQTRLILVPADRTDLIAGLEPTLWKPLSLDSPVIPYARVGTPAAMSRIVTVLQGRELVDRGAWAYSPPSPSGGGRHLDLWGLFTRQINQDAIRRQAAVFRAMGLQIAALRVLAPARSGGPDPQILEEFARCQLELAYDERLRMGRASLFRILAYLAAETDPLPENVERDVLGDPLAQAPEVAGSLDAAVSAYLVADYDRAVESIAADGAAFLYVRALLALEAGRPETTIELLQELLKEYPEDRVCLLAEGLVQELTHE